MKQPGRIVRRLLFRQSLVPASDNRRTDVAVKDLIQRVTALETEDARQKAKLLELERRIVALEP